MLEETIPFNNFMNDLPPKYINKRTNDIDACAILRAIFMDILKNLPEDLSVLKEKCSFYNEYEFLVLKPRYFSLLSKNPKCYTQRFL